MTSKRNKDFGKKNFFTRNLLFIVLIFFLLLSTVFFFISYKASSSIINLQEIGYTLTVTSHDEVGFNLDTDKLHFGHVAPKGVASRSLKVSADMEGFVFVVVDDFDWIYVNEQGLKITSDESLELEFKVMVPSGASFEEFDGVLRIFVLNSESKFPLMFQSGSLVKTFDDVEVVDPSISLNVV